MTTKTANQHVRKPRRTPESDRLRVRQLQEQLKRRARFEILLMVTGILLGAAILQAIHLVGGMQ